MKNMFYKIIAITTLYLSVSFISHASNLTWHGFIAQGIIQASNSNYVNDEGDLSFELTEIGLNASFNLSPKLRIASQAVYLNGGNRYESGARLDYLFLDWSTYSSADWQVNIYLGRFKNNHWLYSATRDVPFTRPSIVLPQSVYFDGFRDIAVASDGVALKVSRSGDFGDFDFNWSWGNSPISQKQTQLLMSNSATGEIEQDFVHQASLFWQPESSGLKVGLSLVDSDFNYLVGPKDIFFESVITLQRTILIGKYNTEHWEFASEVFQERFVLDDFYQPGFHNDQMGQGYYFQSQYRTESNIEMYARYDHFVVNKDDRNGTQLNLASQGTIPQYFAYQKDLSIGIATEIMPKLKVQAEYHWVNGTARLTPVVVPNVQINAQEDWEFWAIQLMYWF